MRNCKGTYDLRGSSKIHLRDHHTQRSGDGNILALAHAGFLHSSMPEGFSGNGGIKYQQRRGKKVSSPTGSFSIHRTAIFQRRVSF
jgi:hypothetical protein